MICSQLPQPWHFPTALVNIQPRLLQVTAQTEIKIENLDEFAGAAVWSSPDDPVSVTWQLMPAGHAACSACGSLIEPAPVEDGTQWVHGCFQMQDLLRAMQAWLAAQDQPG